MKKTAFIGLLFVIYTALIGLLFVIVGVFANGNDQTLIVPAQHHSIQVADSCSPANNVLADGGYQETLVI